MRVILGSLYLLLGLTIGILAGGLACSETTVTQSVTGPDSTATDTTMVPCATDTFYIYIPVPPDTVYVLPSWDCIEECMEQNGLGHWRECLGACIEVHGP